jgi:hypothetical protein
MIKKIIDYLQSVYFFMLFGPILFQETGLAHTRTNTKYTGRNFKITNISIKSWTLYQKRLGLKIRI